MVKRKLLRYSALLILFLFCFSSLSYATILSNKFFIGGMGNLKIFQLSHRSTFLHLRQTSDTAFRAYGWGDGSFVAGVDENNKCSFEIYISGMGDGFFPYVKNITCEGNVYADWSVLLSDLHTIAISFWRR